MESGAHRRKKKYGLLYVTYRKVRFLLRRGTLIRKKRERSRKTCKKAFWIKYAQFLFSTSRKHRYRRLKNAEQARIESGPRGYQSLTGIAVQPPPLPEREHKTLRTRLYRTYRITRFFLYKWSGKRRIRNNKPGEKTSRRKDNLRKILFLLRTGRIFRVSFREIRKVASNRLKTQFGGSNLAVLVNSTTLFLLAYFFVYLVRLFTKAIAAHTLNIRTIVYYQDVDYLIRSSQWTMDSVKVVFTSGPFILLVFSIITLILYTTFLEEKWMARLFIFWIFAHSFIHVCGEVMIGSVVNQGFGYVLMYMFMDDTDKLFISLGAFVVLMLMGFLMGKAMLFTGNIYYNFLAKKGRGHFLLSQYLLPFLLGTALIIAIKQPRILPFEIAIDSTMILFLIPAFIRMPLVNDLYFDEEPRKVRLAFWPLALLIAIMITFRIVLGSGIRL